MLFLYQRKGREGLMQLDTSKIESIDKLGGCYDGVRVNLNYNRLRYSVNLEASTARRLAGLLRSATCPPPAQPFERETK